MTAKFTLLSTQQSAFRSTPHIPVECLYGWYRPYPALDAQLLALPITARQPWKLYNAYPYAGVYAVGKLNGVCKLPSTPPSTDEWIFRAARTIWFADATGLQPHASKQRSAKHHAIPCPEHAGGAHVTFWESQAKTPFILFESYSPIPRLLRELKGANSTFIRVPTAISPYNGCDRHSPSTRSFLLAHSTHRDTLIALETQLWAALVTSPWDEGGMRVIRTSKR